MVNIENVKALKRFYPVSQICQWLGLTNMGLRSKFKQSSPLTTTQAEMLSDNLKKEVVIYNEIINKCII